MSTEESDAASRPTNQNNSVNPEEPGISGSDGTREIPTPEERVAEFFDEYTELAHLPLTREPGTSLREEYVEESWREWQSEAVTDDEDAVQGYEIDSVVPLTWGQAVEICLENYEETRRTTVNLEKGVPSDPEYATFSVDAETRWMEGYQQQYFAQLKAWMRELTGGERPSGGQCEAMFEDPHIVLITRSASSKPDGDRLAGVDHWMSINDCWTDCYHVLRNTLRSMGHDLGDGWQYERRLEPHTGKRGDETGTNVCYAHEHDVIVVDGEVEAEDFAPVLEKHVEECDAAAADAHEVGDAVEVFTPDEMEKDIATYVAAYAGIEPTGLLERPIEYVAWAAMMDASNTRTKSRSDAAKWAAKADQCKQRYEYGKADQDVDHGEELSRSDRRGASIECKHCGSPHGIDQDQTLSAARLQDDGEVEAVADGGVESAEDRLRDAWQDARAAGRVGETRNRMQQREQIENYLRSCPDAPVAEVLQRVDDLPSDFDVARRLVHEVRAGVDAAAPVGFERAPDWRVKSVEIGEEEYPASAGNGVEMVEVTESRGTALSDVYAGREIEEIDETIDFIFKRGKPGQEVRCSVTGERFDAGEGHLVVKTESGKRLIVRNRLNLRQCVL